MRYKKFIASTLLLLVLIPICEGKSLDLDTFSFFSAFTAAIFSGIVGILTGNSGVVFTPFIMGFTTVDPYIVRATGLFVTLAGAITALFFLWRKGLVNIRLIILAVIPYIFFAWVGNLFVNYRYLGDVSDHIFGLLAGALLVVVGLAFIFWGRRVDYPQLQDLDGLTEKLGLYGSYRDESTGKSVDFRAARVWLGIPLICLLGLSPSLPGWLMVPVFAFVMLVPLKVAIVSAFIAVGASQSFIVVSGGIWQYITVSGIIPSFVVVSTAGAVIGILVGSLLLLRVRPSIVRWIIAFLMLGGGINLMRAGLTSLRALM